MKNYFLKLACILGVALFCLLPTANAASGGSSQCGFVTYLQDCSPGGETQRTKCKLVPGESATDCTLVNCDGTTITLNGPYNCKGSK